MDCYGESAFKTGCELREGESAPADEVPIGLSSAVPLLYLVAGGVFDRVPGEADAEVKPFADEVRRRGRKGKSGLGGDERGRVGVELSVGAPHAVPVRDEGEQVADRSGVGRDFDRERLCETRSSLGERQLTPAPVGAVCLDAAIPLLDDEPEGVLGVGPPERYGALVSEGNDPGRLGRVGVGRREAGQAVAPFIVGIWIAELVGVGGEEVDDVFVGVMGEPVHQQGRDACNVWSGSAGCRAGVVRDDARR